MYRYWLVRRWADSGGQVNFVLLNPSTADELRLDPPGVVAIERAGTPVFKPSALGRDAWCGG